MNGISVIIVNYNLTKELIGCISSIFRILQSESFEVIVVDNNSTDKEIENLRHYFPDVKVHLLKSNIGYSSANNFGVEVSKFNYLLFLNPDTLLIEDFVAPITFFIIKNSKAGACGPMLCYSNLSYQNSTGRRIGILYESAEALMFINLYRKILKWLDKSKFNSGEPFRVNWLSGACMLMRKDLFKEIGGFSTEFFLNYEDIDLCKRLEDRGYYNYYFPGTKCIHFDQSSQKKNYEAFVYSRYVSRLVYARRHYKLLENYIVRAVHILGLCLRVLLTNLLYNGVEREQRYRGYKKSLALFFGSSSTI